MKPQDSRFLLNRTAVFQYAIAGVFVFVVLYLIISTPQSWVMYFILFSIIFSALREIYGYRLSDEGTIESYKLLWRARRKSVKISSILALEEVSPKKLAIEYQKEGKSSSLYTTYLLIMRIQS